MINLQFLDKLPNKFKNNITIYDSPGFKNDNFDFWFSKLEAH